ncbi:MAG TPA: hypothetical protein VHR66_27940 [Gemmataceae bacterium]|jgi:hypothetical protein|nr:hypothetical protein [Gemmataceae bacterium]
MTRFESTAVLAIAALIGAAYSPAVAQYIVIDGAKGGESRPVTPEVKGPNGKVKPGKAPKAQPIAEPEKPVEPTFTATGGFESTPEKARESALRAAVDKFRDYLAEQESPVHRMPNHPMDFVRTMLIEKQEKVVTEEAFVNEKTGQTETMYRMTVAVHVTPEKVRELRSQERSSEALWMLAGLGGLAGLAALFFRLDAWTKGYLTSWLALGAVGATTLLAGIWWWAK